jgi:hypothetical protein
MNRVFAAAGLATLVSALAVGPSFAAVAPAPAPLLGAGLPGLAVLAVAGGGYLAVRAFRRRSE